MAAGSVKAVRLVVPAYFHPAVAPHDWAALAALAGRVRLVVLNVASGPGERRDPAFADVLAMLHAQRRRRGVLRRHRLRPPARRRGRVGPRPVPVLVSAGSRPCSSTGSRARATWSGTTRSSPAPRGRRDWTTVVFNHGVHPDPGYAEHADLLGTFEGPWSAYRKLEVPDWARRGPRHAFLHLVHSVPVRSLPAARRLVASRNVGAALRHRPPGQRPRRAEPVATAGDGAVRALRALVAWVAVCSTVAGGCAAAPPLRRRPAGGDTRGDPVGAAARRDLAVAAHRPDRHRRRRRRVRHRRRRVERRDGRRAAPGRAQGRLLRRRGRGRGVPARPRRLPGRRPGRLGRLRRGTPARHPPDRRPAPDHGRAVRHVPRARASTRSRRTWSTATPGTPASP